MDRGLPYRKETIDFHSNISKEDTINAEQVLIDNGIYEDEVAIVLRSWLYAP